MHLILDVNTELYPMVVDERFTCAVARTLNEDGTQDDGSYVPNRRGTLADKFEYVMFGKVYKCDEDPKQPSKMCVLPRAHRSHTGPSTCPMAACSCGCMAMRATSAASSSTATCTCCSVRPSVYCIADPFSHFFNAGPPARPPTEIVNNYVINTLTEHVHTLVVHTLVVLTLVHGTHCAAQLLQRRHSRDTCMAPARATST